MAKRNQTPSQWPVINQNPDVLPSPVRSRVFKQYLPILKDVWKRVERGSGFRWRATSYLRQSPSHSKGIALDIAPDIHPKDRHKYAVYKMSDPVLYKREHLIRTLQNVVWDLPEYKYSVGLFIEPDHIHIGLFIPDGTAPRNKLYKWGTPKPIYGDTYERGKLPLLRGANPFNVT